MGEPTSKPKSELGAKETEGDSTAKTQSAPSDAGAAGPEFEAPFFDAAAWDSAAGEAVDVPDPESDSHTWRRAAFESSAPRRAVFARYVLGAVIAAGLLCTAAMAKAIFVRGRDVGQSPSEAVVLVAPPTQAAPANVEPDASGADANEMQALPLPGPTPSPPSETPDASSGEPATEEPQERDDFVELTKNALREREHARSALEQGNVKASIEAGEHSVALDPTDAESWLILGAAYQESGDVADARRCFRACIDQGTRGPRSECVQLLR